MALLALAWFLSYADRVNMSVASIAMQAEFGWDETTKGLVMAAVFAGYISSQLVGGWLADRLGAARLLAFSVFLFSLMTLLTPAAAGSSFPILLIARVLLGFAEGLAVPASYAFVGRWAPMAERARMLAIVVSGATLGAPGGLLLSGLLVEEVSWQMAFYAFGFLGLFWTVGWSIVARETPGAHPRVTAAERTLIDVDQPPPQERAPVPVRRILSHPVTWALTANKFATLWTVYVFLAWLPTYFSATQGFSIAGSGVSAALPWLAMSGMLAFSSSWADRLLKKGVAIDTVRRQMQTLGLGGSTVCLLMIPLAPTAFAAIVTTCAAMAMLAFCYAGADPAAMEVAPRYRGFVVGFVGTLGNLPGIIAIPLIGFLVDRTGSFSWGFVSAAALNLVALLLWRRFGTGRAVID